jgi:hypothetical protein
MRSFGIALFLWSLSLGLKAQQAAPSGEATDKLAQVTVQVLNLDDSPYAQKEILFIGKKKGQKWLAKTNKEGVADKVLLPIDEVYEIHCNGNFTGKEIKIPNQGYAFLETGTYAQKGIIFTFTYKNEQDKPLPDEEVSLTSLQTKQVFKGMTNKKGQCQLILPMDSAFVLGVKYHPQIRIIRPKDPNAQVEEQSVNFGWMGSKAKDRQLFVEDSIRKAEQAAMLAKKDLVLKRLDSLPSANKADDYHRLDAELLFYEPSLDWAFWKRMAEKKAAAYKVLIAKDPQFLQIRKRGGLAALLRLQAKYPKLLLLLNTNQGTEGYWQDVLLWHLLSGKANRLLFYHAGQQKPYFEWLEAPANAMDPLVKALEKILDNENAGRGRFGESNEGSAIQTALAKRKSDEEIVVFTRCDYAVSDLEALTKTDVPVRIVVTAFKELGPDVYQNRNSCQYNILREVDISPQLLSIAYRSKGSVHTNTQDYWDLHLLKEGQTLNINNERYRLVKGQFVLEGFQKK